MSHLYYPFDMDDITNLLHLHNIIFPLLSLDQVAFHGNVFRLLRVHAEISK